MANKQLDWTKPPSLEPASVGQKAGNSCVQFSQFFASIFPLNFLFSFSSLSTTFIFFSLIVATRLTALFGNESLWARYLFTDCIIAYHHTKGLEFFFSSSSGWAKMEPKVFFLVVFLEVFRNYPSSGIGEQKRCFRMAFIGIPREFCDFHNRRMRVRHPRKAWTEGEILEH